MATCHIGEAVFDHGAQFFTTRGLRFTGLVELLIAEGLVHEWCRGFGVRDGYPRYAVTGGMALLMLRLAGELPDDAVRLNTSIERVESSGDGFTLVAADGSQLEAGSVVLTAPVPRSLALLGEAAEWWLTDHDHRVLDSISYFSTLALLVVPDRLLRVPEPGAIQNSGGRFTFVADNSRKGVSPVPALTVHLNHDESHDRLGEDEGSVTADLLVGLEGVLGGANVIETRLERWRHAGPIHVHPDPCLVADIDGHTLVFAGDAFAGPKVEGAITSGWSAAAALLS